MSTGTKTRTTQILAIMNVIAWMAFIGYAINAGAILTSYVVSWFNPNASKNMYLQLNKNVLEQYSFLQYTMSISFMFAILCIKAQIALLVTRVLGKVNLENPFKTRVALALEKISYLLITIATLAFLANAHTDWLQKRTGIEGDKLTTQEILVTAGLVFIISQIFRRGVELQAESDLTV